ncbi:LOW QUALITY PROTEIN: leukocyte receptor cluster member 1 homolog [Aphomia sociella]
MNILPKKRWHVRTKENIARVRKDEAEAAEKEKQERLRTENADREARLNVLKQKSKQKLRDCGIHETEQPTSSVSTSKHINLFEDLDHAVNTTNKEHDKETKEKEEYEKKIGYLTYLGQDTNEALKKKNWYEVLPESRHSNIGSIKDTYEKLVLRDEDGKPKVREIDIKGGEVNWKAKQALDPICKFKKYCGDQVRPKQNLVKKSNDEHCTLTMINEYNRKHKKEGKKINVEKEKKLQKLREARIKREQEEKRRTEMFLSGFSNTPTRDDKQNTSKVKAKYNSQFNPELARQNFK